MRRFTNLLDKCDDVSWRWLLKLHLYVGSRKVNFISYHDGENYTELQDYVKIDHNKTKFDRFNVLPAIHKYVTYFKTFPKDISLKITNILQQFNAFFQANSKGNREYYLKHNIQMFTDDYAQELFWLMNNNEDNSEVFGTYDDVDDCSQKENLYNQIILLPNYQALEQSAAE